MSVLDKIKKNKKSVPSKTTAQSKAVSGMKNKPAPKAATVASNSKDHDFIAHLQIGDNFKSVYYVEKAFVKKTVTNKDYTDVVLRDASGSNFIKIWENAGLDGGEWIEVTGVAQDYQGLLSLVCNKFSVVSEPKNLENYVPTSLTIEEDTVILDGLRASVTNETCQNVISMVFDDGDFFESLMNNPYGVFPHYGRVGGLLSKTVNAGKAIDKVIDLYGLNELEVQIARTASLIHAVGSVDCYNMDNCAPVKTKYGELVGEGKASVAKIQKAIDLLADGGDVDLDISHRLIHAVACVSDKDVLPRTKEAIIVNSVIRMDAELVEAIDFIAIDENKGDFTAFDSKTKRSYLK